MTTPIENPILNIPFQAATRHFRTDEDVTTNTIDEWRRKSAYAMPIAQRRRRARSGPFETEWTLDRTAQGNRIRERVDAWPKGGYVSITSTPRRLLEHSNDPARDCKPFFCQRETVETAIYITDVAPRYGDGWTQSRIRRHASGRSSLGLNVRQCGDGAVAVAFTSRPHVPGGGPTDLGSCRPRAVPYRTTLGRRVSAATPERNKPWRFHAGGPVDLSPHEGRQLAGSIHLGRTRNDSPTTTGHSTQSAAARSPPQGWKIGGL